MASLINAYIGTLVENGLRIVTMAVVDLIGVVGDITEAKNAMRAVDLWDGAMDGVVRLCDHIHRRVIRRPSYIVSKVRRLQNLVILRRNIRIKVARIAVRPVVQVLLKLDRDGRSCLINCLRSLYRRVSTLIYGEWPITGRITWSSRSNRHVSPFSGFNVAQFLESLKGKHTWCRNT